MNAIAFATKRAFHGFLRVTRKPFASLGLTAARFDMMSALSDPHGLRQRDLREKLGVCASVISRMLRSLEDLGLVERFEVYGDRRQRWVKLTDKGRESIRAARATLFRAVQRLVYAAICFGKHRDPGARFVHMCQLESYLRALRQDFGDVASLYYRWGHPDD